MMKTKLARAISLTLAGGALAFGAVSTASATATTMYNMNNFGGLNSNTDGWVWSDPANTQTGAAGPNKAANTTTGAPAGGNLPNFQSATRTSNFVGTTAGATPFGFNATSSLNWAVQLGAAGDSAQISAQDSTKYSAEANYSGPAEIDTGAGAWQDNAAVTTNTTTGVTTGPTGWKHQTDIGLLKADQDMWVTLTPSVVAGGAPAFVGNFGLTVFYGMDSNTGSYSHHGRWNCPSCSSAPGFSYTNSNPFGTQGVSYMTHDATVDSNNALTFFANAGLTYSIYLGGAGVGTWGANLANYQLDITTAPVPVPAAAWLFGGALMSLVGARRRKNVLPA